MSYEISTIKKKCSVAQVQQFFVNKQQQVAKLINYETVCSKKKKNLKFAWKTSFGEKGKFKAKHNSLVFLGGTIKSLFGVSYYSITQKVDISKVKCVELCK